MAGSKDNLESKWLTIYLRGGIGNQLLQFVHGRELSNQTGRKLRLSTALLPQSPDSFRGVGRWPYSLEQLENLEAELDERFHQPPGRTSSLSKALSGLERVIEASPGTLGLLGFASSSTIRDLKKMRNRTVRLIPQVLDGNAAVSAAPYLKQKFSRLTDTSKKFLKLKNDFLLSKPNVVHVRSGDFDSLSTLYGDLGAEYWRKASTTFNPDRPIVVFTDSPDPNEKLRAIGLKSDQLIGRSSGISPAETLFLMSLGTSFTGSNSTFSWWAALLGDTRRSVTLPLVDAPNSIGTFGRPQTHWRWIKA